MSEEIPKNFGTFVNPHGNVSVFGSEGEPGGLVRLFNAGLQIMFVVAGIYTFFQFFYGGFEFINAQGDSKKIKNAWFRIWKSLVGLIIMLTSFIAAIILGQILFGDPGAILNLQLFGAPGATGE